MTELEAKAREYFLEKDNNCAESTLRIANDLYGFGLDGNAIRLVSAFGGGMGCGKTCGVICGCLAAYGKMTVNGRAHATEKFSPNCMKLYRAMTKALGADMCAELKPMYFDKETRCLKKVEIGLDAFEKFMADSGNE